MYVILTNMPNVQMLSVIKLKNVFLCCLDPVQGTRYLIISLYIFVHPFRALVCAELVYKLDEKSTTNV